MTQDRFAGDLPAGSPARISGRVARLACVLAALMVVSGCQSALAPDAWDHGEVNYASARRGGFANRAKPLDLTLEPGVTYDGCLVVESVKQENAQFGLGLVC